MEYVGVVTRGKEPFYTAWVAEFDGLATRSDMKRIGNSSLQTPAGEQARNDMHGVLRWVTSGIGEALVLNLVMSFRMNAGSVFERRLWLL